MKQSVKKNLKEVNTVAYDDVIQYCLDISSGKIIACGQIKQQVKRFQYDLKGDYYVDENLYNLCINFFGIIKHFSSFHAGKPFILLDWQKFIIANIVCLKHKQSHKNKYRRQYIQLARKQGKTMLMQALSLFYLVQMDEWDGQVILAQNSQNQAQIIFSMAERIQHQLDPDYRLFRYLRGKKIYYHHLFGSLQVIAQQSKFLDGMSASMQVIDEYHQQESSSALDAIVLSQGARLNPMTVIITTQGKNLDSVCYEEYVQAKDVVYGAIKDDNFFVQIWEQDNIEEIENPKMWIKSNPSIGEAVTLDYMNEEYNKYLLYQNKQTDILTKTFNLWVNNQNDPFVEEKYLMASMNEDVKFSDEYLTYIGIDLQSVNDLSQVAYLQYNEQDDKFVQKVDFYYPKLELKQNNITSKLIEWNRQNFIHFTESNVCDYNVILNHILQFSNYFPVSAIIYDSYNQTQFAINATEQNLNMVSYSQSIGQFNKPTKEIQRLLLSERIQIEQNPVLLWNFRNVALKVDENNQNCKPVKRNSKDKIDGVIALIQALAGYQLSEQHTINII